MDFVSPTVHKSGTALHVSHGSDSNLFVEFFVEPVLQTAESERVGHPVYKDAEFVSIETPGDRTKKLVRKVELNSNHEANKFSDPERFPRQWEAFKNKTLYVPDGLPVTEWGAITKSQALELKGMGFHTVEQISLASDMQISKIFGGHDLRNKAQIYLKNAKDGSEVTRLLAENKVLSEDLVMLKQQVAELASRIPTEKNITKLKLKTTED